MSHENKKLYLNSLKVALRQFLYLFDICIICFYQFTLFINLSQNKLHI